VYFEKEIKIRISNYDKSEVCKQMELVFLIKISILVSQTVTSCMEMNLEEFGVLLELLFVELLNL
jgi:hypothetical protein